MRKSTMTDLVEELTALNVGGRLDEIITEAKAGEFHDYKNEKYVCGKVTLVDKLRKFPECDDIRIGVMKGDYDESPDKEDKAQMRKDLIEDMGEAAAKPLLKQLGLE
jgi:hypothetical protein